MTIAEEPAKDIDGNNATVTAKSSVSANLQKNDKIVVEVRTGTNWADGIYDPVGSRSYLYAYLEVRDPNGNSTEFEISYTPSSGGILALWNISVTRENLDGLNTTALYNQLLNTYDGIGGIVGYNGIYTVVLTDTWPTKTAPPSFLGIYVGKIVEQYPYIMLLPVGVAVGALGAVTTFFGFRNQRPKHLPKRRSSHFLRR